LCVVIKPIARFFAPPMGKKALETMRVAILRNIEDFPQFGGQLNYSRPPG
jgi:hypothetical protein